MLARRTFFCCYNRIRVNSRSSSQFPQETSSKNSPVVTSTDALGLPLTPPWSVHELISAYPSPTLSNATLTRLHDLAALVPPKEGSPEFEQLKREMEDLVKLVEAVRMAPESVQKEHSPPDGRVWASGRGITLDPSEEEQCQSEVPPSGRALLEHAQRTQNGFYLVDSARTKP